LDGKTHKTNRQYLIKKILESKPKWKIIQLINKKFIVQEFFGIWKLGVYCDVAKNEIYKYDPRQFEHDSFEEAEKTLKKAIDFSNNRIKKTKTLLTLGKK
jgi:hypothetical protein